MLGEEFAEQIERLKFGVQKSMLLKESFLVRQQLTVIIIISIIFKIKYVQWLTPSGFKSLLALIGTNGQGVGTSVFQQWSNNCKKHLPADHMEVFEKFVDNAYEVMEQGNSFFSFFFINILISLLNSCWS